MQPAKFPGPRVHDYRQNFQDHESMITAFLSNSISLAVLEQANFFLIVYDNWQMLHNLCFMYIHKRTKMVTPAELLQQNLYNLHQS